MIGKKIKVSIERPSRTLKDEDGKPQMMTSVIDVEVIDKVLSPVVTQMGSVACDMYLCVDDQKHAVLVAPKEVVEVY